jgi:hypothetical protein
VVKTQSFQTTGQKLLATRVDESARTVLEFNHQPALTAYAAALGVAEPQAPALFPRHPLGLMVHDEPFVRSLQRVENQSIVSFCTIQEGMELEILEATDIVHDTRVAIESMKALGKIQGLIEFQCVLRTKQLQGENRCRDYCDIFEGIPWAGFSTYGEAYLGYVNQTSVFLVLR